jgi:solute:Na+ symporter, SSS family
MDGVESFYLGSLDYAAFFAYLVVLSAIGWWAGRKEKLDADDYFLAGRTLPWYVVGGSFIASNISSEHFIGMVGAATVYGICVAMAEWGNVLSFSLLIWFFIPFLLASRVFTAPEFMERRFHPVLRQFFAFLTIITNVVAFLAAVLYGGAVALQSLFGWGFWTSVISLAVLAGTWAIYGGLRSVAWTDFFTAMVMIVGGVMVTLLGLDALSGESHSIIEGWRVMIERNQAQSGVWREVVQRNAEYIAGTNTYHRLSVIQPVTHATNPWPSLFLGLFSVSIWYNVINQFMIQRVLGARNLYHARMGIVFAGFMKVIMPFIVVVPGLILFAQYPEVMQLPWKEIRPEADQGYVRLIQTLVPVGLRGILLAALFGAIYDTVNAVLNSTATLITLDIYKRLINPQASDKHLVKFGMITSVVVLIVSIIMAGSIEKLSGSLFIYVQTLYAFFAPPFGAVFLLGVLWRRINAAGAIAAVFAGFLFGIAIKLYVSYFDHPAWIEPYAIQGIVNWAFCALLCTVVSLMTPPPRADQVSDQLTMNWRKMNIFDDLGDRWYTSVITWWLLFVVSVAALIVVFSGFVL